MIIAYIRAWLRFRRITRHYCWDEFQQLLWDHRGRELPVSSPEYRELLPSWLWVSLLHYYRKNTLWYRIKHRNNSNLSNMNDQNF